MPQLELGTVAGWITAISTTGGMATLIGLVLRYKLGSRKLDLDQNTQNDAQSAAFQAVLLGRIEKLERDLQTEREACEAKIQSLQNQLIALALGKPLPMDAPAVAEAIRRAYPLPAKLNEPLEELNHIDVPRSKA